MEETMSGMVPAHKGKRFASDFIDLFIIPLVLGFLIGLVLVLVGAPDIVRTVVMMIVNAAWLTFRDAVFAPGRAMVKIKVVSANGGKVSVLQAFLRNILLIIPIVLLLGYILETVMVLLKGHRLEDSWAQTQVVEA